MKESVDTGAGMDYGIAMITSETGMSNESTTKGECKMSTSLRTDAGYCSTKSYDCATCSLCNYGRDCHNNAHANTDTPWYLVGDENARAKIKARQESSK